MLIPVGALWAVGVVVAAPFVAWWARDFGRIPGRIWYWSGYPRRAWQWAVLLGWAAGGVIAIIAVLRWRGSTARAELLEDLHERIAAHDARVAEEERLAVEQRAADEACILLDAQAPIDLRDEPADEDTDRPNLHLLPTDTRASRVVDGTHERAARRTGG